MFESSNKKVYVFKLRKNSLQTTKINNLKLKPMYKYLFANRINSMHYLIFYNFSKHSQIVIRFILHRTHKKFRDRVG